MDPQGFSLKHEGLRMGGAVARRRLSADGLDLAESVSRSVSTNFALGSETLGARIIASRRLGSRVLDKQRDRPVGPVGEGRLLHGAIFACFQAG